MLVTEQDTAITTKWRPVIQIRLEKSAFAFNGSHPGRKGRFKNMPGRNFFPGRVIRRAFSQISPGGCAAAPSASFLGPRSTGI